MPMAISFVGAQIIWKFVYDYRDPSQPQIGLAEPDTQVRLGCSTPTSSLLNEPWNTLFLIVIMIWVQTGFAMAVLSAAIKAIPDDIIEAAPPRRRRRGLRMFRNVTVPMHPAVADRGR